MKWFAEWRINRLCKEAEKCCVKYGKIKVVSKLSQALGSSDLHTHSLDDFKHEDACHDPNNHTHDHNIHVHDDNCLEDLHLHDHHYENHVHSDDATKSHHMHTQHTSNGTYISELDDTKK